jgi:hypothetical protein
MLIGIALSTASRYAEALVELEEAVAVLEWALGREQEFGGVYAEAAFERARALWNAGGARDRRDGATRFAL